MAGVASSSCKTKISSKRFTIDDKQYAKFAVLTIKTLQGKDVNRVAL